MVIFGWLVLLLISLYVSLAYLMLCSQTLGKYNIGGVPTTVSEKLGTLALGIALMWWWSKVFAWSPFVLAVAT